MLLLLVSMPSDWGDIFWVFLPSLDVGIEVGELFVNVENAAMFFEACEEYCATSTEAFVPAQRPSWAVNKDWMSINRSTVPLYCVFITHV